MLNSNMLAILFFVKIYLKNDKKVYFAQITNYSRNKNKKGQIIENLSILYTFRVERFSFIVARFEFRVELEPKNMEKLYFD
jgi:hypothetical protein